MPQSIHRTDSGCRGCRSVSYTHLDVYKRQVTHGTHNIGVRGENFDVLFSDLNGGLTSYRYAGKEMIQEIPRPNFWRAPTDNDCGNNMGGVRGSPGESRERKKTARESRNSASTNPSARLTAFFTARFIFSPS